MEEIDVVTKTPKPLAEKPKEEATGLPITSFNTQALLIGLFVLILGIVTGYFLNSTTRFKPTEKIEVLKETGDELKKGQAYGSTDTKAFRDSAEGTLEKGGLEGEGSHRLIRPGGESQTAYLTSSTLDLDKFVGKKVKVWGETYEAEKAGWFMDVGRVEILE